MDGMETFAVVEQEMAATGLADVHGVGKQGFEDRLQFARRTGCDAQTFDVAVCCSRASVGSASAPAPPRKGGRCRWQ